MDQVEFENLIEKMKRRRAEGDLKTAARVADKIPWDEVEDTNVLMFAASIYDEAEQYNDAKVILDYAYEIAPVKNRLYFALCLNCIKRKDLKEAINYYIDFINSFPEDNRKNLLKYYILKAKGAPFDQQKRVLYEYVKEEKDEELMFEMALLSDKLGEKDEVLSYCNYIINFFGIKKNGFGKNALLLKKKYEPLSVAEEKLLEDANIGYIKDEDAKINYKESPILYNETKIEEDRKEIPIEKVERVASAYEQRKLDEILKNNDELNEKSITNEIQTTYIPDEESYSDKEKNKMAFLNDNQSVDKDKLKRMINKLKIEEKISTSEFNKFRDKSFILLGRSRGMKLSETKLHMIIEAHSKDEGIDIAQKELTYIHDVLKEKVSTAKASAYNMNEKGFSFYEEKIGGKDLIIENAGQLRNEILDEIEEFIINKKGKTIFALVDVINNFDKLATERPSFISRFDVYSVLSSRPQETLDASSDEIEAFKTANSIEKIKPVTYTVEKVTEKVAAPRKAPEEQVNMKVESPKTLVNKGKSGMSIEEFINECKEYAKSIDCNIVSEAIPMLYEKAEDMQEEKIPLNAETAVALIEEAADRAEKPKLFSKPKYDKDGCLILSEEHFKF